MGKPGDGGGGVGLEGMLKVLKLSEVDRSNVRRAEQREGGRRGGAGPARGG